jgi:uncharacterized repeat protein (TIGR02543 family)
MRRIAGIVTTLVATLAVGVAPAYATTSNGISLFISAPFVQGSGVTGAGTFTETFEGYTSGTPLMSEGRTGWVCPLTIQGGSLDATPAMSGIDGCFISQAGVYGGASSNSSAPSNGGVGSDYPGVPFYSSGAARNFTVTFGAQPVKYVGFWWSAGNSGNVVTFYDATGPIASLDTAELSAADKLGANPPADWPGGNGNVISIGGTPYPKGQYFGNPRFNTATTPSPTADSGFQFVYLNLFLTGSAGATKMEFSGPGFEIDNLTISTLEQIPDSSMVFIGGVLGKTVTFRDGAPFDAGTPTASGTMAPQTSNSSTNLIANGYTREGYVFTGWNTDANGTGTPYGDTANFAFDADLTLYAQWELAPSSAVGGSPENPVALTAPQLAATGVEIPVGLLAAVGTLSLGVVAIFASKGIARRRSRSV